LLWTIVLEYHFGNLQHLFFLHALLCQLGDGDQQDGPVPWSHHYNANAPKQMDLVLIEGSVPNNVWDQAIYLAAGERVLVTVSHGNDVGMPY
jgi:hypothetical protein